MNSLEIRDRLKKLDTSKLSGSTVDRVSQFYQQTGVFWKDALIYLADQGYSVEEAGKLFGVTRLALYMFCYRRNVQIPWQGINSPRYKARRAKAQEGKAFFTPEAKQHTAFGTTGTAMELLNQFGHESLTMSSIYSRLRRGWDIETALTTPNNQPNGRASKFYGKLSNKAA